VVNSALNLFPDYTDALHTNQVIYALLCNFIRRIKIGFATAHLSGNFTPD
jgi:hypothetical protein